MSARVLIIGATGFLGKRLVSLLTEQEMDIIHCSKSCHFKQSDKKITFVEYDCTQPQTFPKKLIGTFDYAIYVAQPTYYNNFPDQSRDIFYINTVSLFELADYFCKIGAKKLIFASSGGVYSPRHDFEPLSENKELTFRVKPGFYLGTKCISEYLLKHFKNYISYTSLRYFFIYGPQQRREMLLPRLISLIKDKKPIQLMGKQGFSFNPIYVDDAARVTVDILFKNTSKTINVAGSEIVSLKTVVEQIRNIINISPIYEYHDSLPQNYIADISHLQKYSLIPKVKLEEGLRNTINAL